MKTADEENRLLDADPCKRLALSVFRDHQDAEHQLRLFRGWKRKFVASAKLAAVHGRAMMTSGQQPTHTSWWPAATLPPPARAALFTTTTEVKQPQVKP